MSLRIAFDLDGTLADLGLALDAVTDELFLQRKGPGGSPSERAPQQPRSTQAGEGKPLDEGAADAEALTPEEEELEPARVRALTSRQQREVWETVRKTTNFWETLPESEPGIVARLAAVAAEHRWEVIFITQRPPADGGTTQRQSQRWLVSHGFEMPSVFVLPAGASRGKVATALFLDIVVDDRAENCLDVKVDSKARAFLVSRHPSENLAENAKRMGIEVVASVGECLDHLAAMPPKPGLLGRLRKMMGAQAIC